MNPYFDCLVTYLYNIIAGRQGILATDACRNKSAGQCIYNCLGIARYDYFAVCYLDSCFFRYRLNIGKVVFICDNVAKIAPHLGCLVCSNSCFIWHNKCCICKVCPFKRIGIHFGRSFALTYHTYKRTLLK